MADNPPATPARDGTERAAILLMTLGEKEAAEVLKHMGAREVQRIGSAMTQVGSISKADVLEVIAEFNLRAESQTSLGVGSDEFVRKTLVSALGEDRAANVIDRILTNRSSKGLDSLKWMDGKAIAEMLRSEHPQIIATILSYLEPEHSAEVVGALPESVRVEAMLRIGMLEGIQPGALRELDQVIEKQFSAAAGSQTSAIGGPKCAANIINNLDPSVESVLMEKIRAADESLGQKIEDLLFVFGNLVEVDDRGMQEILRQVPSDKLLLAFKGADQALKDKDIQEHVAACG